MLKNMLRYKSSSVFALALASLLVLIVPASHASAATQFGKIVYVSRVDQNSEFVVHSMNPDGSNKHDYASNLSTTTFNPVFSPDESKIVYSSAGKIFIMNTGSTSSNTILTNDQLDASMPTFSPDGTKIMYVGQADGNAQSTIYVMNLDGSNKTEIAAVNQSPEYPQFSADGTKIVYGSNHAIYTKGYPTGGNVNVTSELSNPIESKAPSFSPDGTKIIYSQRSGTQGSYSLYTMNVDGTSKTQITNGGDEIFASYSPDGTKIVYDKAGKIFSANTDGTNSVDLTSDLVSGSYATMARFSPKTVIASSVDTDQSGKQIVTVNENLSTQPYNLTNQILVVGASGQVGTVTVGNGAILKGTGTTAAVSVIAGGHIAPGNSPGCLNTGSLSIAGTYDAELGGTTACTQYDQLKVTGTVDLTGGTLNLSRYNNFAPTMGDSFTIIDNDGSDAVTGTFTGLAQGATVTVDGYTFTVSYIGGDGNDVTLTVSAIDPAAVAAAAAAAIPGTPNTGVKLFMANPLVTLGGTVLSAGALLVLARKYRLFTK